MCGIAGLIDPNLPASAIAPIIRRMTDSMRHRGPDDEGFYIADGVGIGMRRLSIIDLEGGHQPIANEDASLQVVFNGEIYNYLELKAVLTAGGHVFRTCCDTEVIVHSYEEKGTRCLHDLRGMFAIAVWDQANRRLFLGRDRLGKKPLFYSLRNGRLIFGSEIKALLAADATLAEIDLQSMVSYFLYGFVPEPRTMFRHIWKLPAASWLSHADGRTQIEPYWLLDFNHVDHTRSLAEWVEELDALLAESVRIRLRSDVPLGVFLSGGVDSSTLVAYAQQHSTQPLKTFTIGFDREDWDESRDAELVARHLNTDHHVLTLSVDDLKSSVPETLQTLVRHFDEPFGDASALPTFFISRLAREHATVILGGDGGDELFCGYSVNRGMQFAEWYRQLPKWFGHLLLPSAISKIAETLPPGNARYAFLRAAKVTSDSSIPFDQAYFSKLSLCSRDLLRTILTPNLLAQLNCESLQGSADITAVLHSNLPMLSKLGYAGFKFGLLDDMLVKIDRMSMANSLEVRSPFLDHHLVEFVSRMPPTLKLRGSQTKAILRQTVRRYLPTGTLRKRKHGFSIPLREWLRGDMYHVVSDFLLSNSHLPSEMFRLSVVQSLLVQHRDGLVDHSGIIWLLLNYAMWHQLYVVGRTI